MTKKYVAAPVYDHQDPSHIVHYKEFSLKQHDFVFVDEAQDISPADCRTVQRSLKPNGRLLAFSDVAQMLYCYRGASPEVLSQLLLGARVHQSPVNYRQVTWLLLHACLAVCLSWFARLFLPLCLC